MIADTYILQYMGEVQDLPASDGEEDDEDEDEDDEEEDEEEEDEDEDEETVPEAEGSRSAPVDEETARKQIADRLEAIRLNKALGNDDPSDAHDHDLDPDVQDYEDDESSGSDSDSSDALSDGPPASDFTAYTREPKPRPERMTKKQLGQSSRKTDLRHAIAHKVGKERDLQLRLSGQASGATGGGAKAGKAKGHKWKSNPAYLVGKAGGGDGW